LRRRAEGRAPFHIRDSQSFRFRICASRLRTGPPLPAGQDHPPDRGQSQYSPSEVVDGCFGIEMGCEVWDRFTIHFTPAHGSLGRRRIPDLKTLRRESCAWRRRMNRDRIKINWNFDRSTARRKFGYKRILQAVRQLVACPPLPPRLRR
jgi:hypothetical protein